MTPDLANWVREYDRESRRLERGEPKQERPAHSETDAALKEAIVTMARQGQITLTAARDAIKAQGVESA